MAKKTTPAQQEATNRYHREKMESISLRCPLGTKGPIMDHAKLMGEPMAQFILRACRETIERDRADIARRMKESRK